VTSLASKMNRLMPIFVALIGILALVQLLSYVGPWLISMAPWLADHPRATEWTLSSLAAVSVSLVILGWLRASGRIPRLLTRWTWLMDILDRLTNRHELELQLKGKVEAQAIYIDADALARSLKSQVVGQDNICDDVAAQIRRRLALQQRGKPTGVFLFAGPPGAGKTYLGKVLAKELKAQAHPSRYDSIFHRRSCGDFTFRIAQRLCWLRYLWKIDIVAARHAH
jgi:hypothetical protein